MATAGMTLLRRLIGLPAGRFGKWGVVVAWLAVAVFAGPLAGKLGDILDNDEKNWLPAGAESTRAMELAEREFPADQTSDLIVVYARADGITTADRDAARRDRVELAGLADAPIAEPRLARDGEAMLMSVPVATVTLEDFDAIKELVGTARAVVAADLPAGLDIATTGAAASRADAAMASGEMDTTLTLVTVGVVAVLLLITYRSPLLLLLPLFGIGFGAVLAYATVYLLGAHAGITVSGTSQFLLTVLVFGVGTDYALLLISRYREELRHHADRHQAMAEALRRSIGSILASMATVMLASLALLLADMNSTRGLGPVIAVGVLSAMVAMITLLPALLTIFGRWLFWPRIPRHTADEPEAVTPAGLWTRVAALVGRRPRRTWVVTAALLAALTGGAALLQVGGLTGADNYTRTPPFVAGQQLLNEHFPAGSTAPTDVYAPTGAAPAVADATAATPGVVAVEDGENSAHGWTRVPVVLEDTPTSDAAQHTVDELRASVHRVDHRVLVGGTAATVFDTNQAMNRDLKLIVPVVLAVIIVVLGWLLRAVIAPLVLLAAVTLSTGAAVGVSTLIFHAAGFPRTDQSVLTLGLLFMVTLGVDYTIFLMSRAREEITRRGHRTGTLHALTATGGVITSAGIVLAATFLVFTVSPVVLNIQLGIFVAAGVLIDTLIVRSLLVPALALDIGRHTWWPSRLARANPTARRW